MAQLSPFTDGVWTHDSSIALALGVRLPLRMTVLRLPSGTLLLHNPVPLDDELVDELSALGEVGEIVAPNLSHHLSVGPALRRFPFARVRGCPGLTAKKEPPTKLAPG